MNSDSITSQDDNDLPSRKSLKRERNVFVPLFSNESLDEAKAILINDGFRERSHRDRYIYFTCKKRGCKRMTRIKIFPNIYLVSWNGKEHTCDVSSPKKGAKPMEIKRMVEEKFSSPNIEIKKIRNFCSNLRRSLLS